MTQDSKYTVSFNNILHIDDIQQANGISLAITSDKNKAYESFEDTNVSSLLRVIGGTWSDQITTSKISSIYESNSIEIGQHDTVLDMPVGVLNAGTTTADISLSGSNINLNDKLVLNDTNGLNIDVSNFNVSVNNSINLNNILTIDDSNVRINGELLLGSGSDNMNAMAENINFNYSNLLEFNSYQSNTYISANDSSGSTVIKSHSNIDTITDNFKLSTNSSNTTFNLYEDNIEINTINYKINSNIEISNHITSQSNDSNYVYSTVQEIHNTPYFNIDTGTSKLTLDGDNAHFETSNLNVVATGMIDTQAPIFKFNNMMNLNDETNTATIDTDSISINNGVLSILCNSSLDTNVSTTSITSTTSESHNTPLFSINNNNQNAYLKIDKSTGSNIISSQNLHSVSSSIIKSTASAINSSASLSIKSTAPVHEVNTINDKAYMKIDKAVGSIELGTNTTTTTNMKTKALNITSQNTANITTNQFSINSSGDGANINLNKNTSTINIGNSSLAVLKTSAESYELNNSSSDTSYMNFNKSSKTGKINSEKLYLNYGQTTEIFADEQDSKLTIGTENLSETHIHGNNVYIGDPGKTTTIYGNIVTYSEGSNIVLNTITENTAAFKVHNTGTDIALLVQQNNALGSNEDVAQFITHDDQDRTAMRIDGEGRIGVGMSKSSNIDAWLHVTRKDPDNTTYSMFRVDDYENDTTPFIIKEDGQIGVGTANPNVSVHINSTDSIKIPKGTTAQRPTANNDDHKGYIRYNTTTNQFEGFGAGNTWGSLGGVIDVDQDTYIKAESTAGGDNDELWFYTAGTEKMRIAQNGYIGVGTANPNVSVHIDSTDSIKIPKGTTAQRPTANTDDHKGYIRYNTTTNQFEGFGAGNTWGTLGGVIDVDQDTYIKAESTAGGDNDELWFYTAGTEKMRITKDGSVGIGTSSPQYPVDISGNVNLQNNLYIDGNVIPNTNEASDLGSINNRFRDIYVSENSIWLGDDHKLDINRNKIRFRKRRRSALPSRLTDAGILPTDDLVEVAPGLIKPVQDLSLEDLYTMGRGKDVIDPAATINDLLTEDDFEDNTPAITWADNGVNDDLFYTKGNVAIGKELPEYKLDVNGDINYLGTLSCNGVDMFNEVYNTIDYNNTYLKTDVSRSKLDIGSSSLDDITIDANNITIGREGGTTTILGDFVAYGTGSNIVVDTITQETTSFLVKNLGTKSALVVQQTNELGSNQDVAQFITHDTVERAAFRIDGDGHVGIGMDRDSNIDAWLHITRLDPSENSTPMLRIDDIENDTTPFIVSSNGYVGINNELPEYELDVSGDINFDGTLTCNGINVIQELEKKIQNGNLYVYPDEDNLSIQIGDDTVNDVILKGSNITIGKPGSTTTILGDFVSYSSGSNIVVNTVTQESSSFYINNVGTDIGLLVKQENVMNCNIDIARFVTTDDDDKSALRMDYDGKVGIGVLNNCNVEALLHINKEDQTDSNISQFKITDFDNDKIPFIVTHDGKIGINKVDPVTDLEIAGKTQTTELIAGTVLGELVNADDDFIRWDFRDEGCNIVNYGTSNIMYNANIYNFNKRLINTDSDSMVDREKNLMIWYKFEDLSSSNIMNYANYNNSYYDDPNATYEPQVQDIDIIKRVRGNYGVYMLYIDSERLINNGEAYIFPNESDIPNLLSTLEKQFSFSVFIRVEDITLPSVSLISAKINDGNTLLNIKIVEDGFVEFLIGNKTGQQYTIKTVTPIKEQADTNYIFKLYTDKDSKTAEMKIYKDGFLDVELNISNFEPKFNEENVIVRYCSDISTEISPMFIKDVRFFERMLTQEEIYGINGRDKFGNINRNVQISADADYLLHVQGNLKVNESLVINNGVVHKIFFSTGGNVFTGTNNDSLCKLGIMMSWSNNLSDYFDIASYIFRLSCKFHACTSSENNALSYRKFEVFITPKDDPLNNLPGNVVTTEESDTVSSTMSIRDTVLERRGPTSVLLLIEFKNYDNVNNTLRGYIDCDLLASSELGLFTLESYTDLDGQGFIF